MAKKVAKKKLDDVKWSEWLLEYWPEGTGCSVAEKARRYVKRAEAKGWSPSEVFNRAPKWLQVQAEARAVDDALSDQFDALRTAYDVTENMWHAIRTHSGASPKFKRAVEAFQRAVKAERERLKCERARWCRVVVPRATRGVNTLPVRRSFSLVRRYSKVTSR